MEPDFKDAVNGPIEIPKAPHQLVFTSDWDRTLSNITTFNYELLEFLSDAKRAGHRVVITSSASLDPVIEGFTLFTRSARRRGYDVPADIAFEFISKSTLKAMEFEADYAFDDQPIKNQEIARYVKTAAEIRVHSDFTLSPLQMNHLRALCELPRPPKSTDLQLQHLTQG